MRDTQEYTGRLRVIERLPSSINGNPRYMLMIGSEICRTAVDSGHAYGVTNYDGKIVKATIGRHYGKLTLGTIEGVE